MVVQEFVIVGWSDPEGSRPHLGARLLGYYTDDGKLIYAGRVGTGMPVKVLADVRRRLEPLSRRSSPLSVPPPRSTRFGSPLVLSRVDWVEPKLVAEITYLTWTADGLLRHTVYVGLREDKPADQVRREATRLIGGSGQSSISQRQSGVDVKRTLRMAGLDIAEGGKRTLDDSAEMALHLIRWTRASAIGTRPVARSIPLRSTAGLMRPYGGSASQWTDFVCSAASLHLPRC
jgi:ATP dependent DNA ligase C terminal region